MKTYFLLTLCTLLHLNSYSQSRTLLSVNLATNTIDTISNIELSNLTCDKTAFNFGAYDTNIGELPTEVDQSDLFQGSQWTNKRPVANNYNIEDYPFRTSVRTFGVEDNSLISNCSGSMIGPKHVLTAAHCVSATGLDFYYEDFFVCPIYDEGAVSEVFDCSYVNKISVFDNWGLFGEDFAVLELEEAIGLETGWIGLGYDEELKYENKVLHKFSYPNWENIMEDPSGYNGDTLFHSYGKPDAIDEFFIGFSGASGVPGESGSSVIDIETAETYTSYGVGTWAGNFEHSRMAKDLFYPIKHLLAGELTDVSTMQASTSQWKVFPNPTTDRIQFSSGTGVSKESFINIYNAAGSFIMNQNIRDGDFVDVSSFPEGTYFVRMMDDLVFKLVKR